LIHAYEEAMDLKAICSIIDQKGVVIYANKKLSEISKYSNNEVVGHHNSLTDSDLHPKNFYDQMWLSLGTISIEGKNSSYSGKQ
jgi:PAS domain-containing protein